MDPIQTCHMILGALAADDLDDALEHYSDLQAWREAGGFPPPQDLLSMVLEGLERVSRKPI